MVNRNYLIQHLMAKNILNRDGSLNVRCVSKLQKDPDLLQFIVEYTSFLQYSAPIPVRLRCIVDNIHTQPKCKKCGILVKMRTQGKVRNTFPNYCSSTCFATTEQVKEKRKQTNLTRYNRTNYLGDSKGKELLNRKYGVTNPRWITNT